MIEKLKLIFDKTNYNKEYYSYFDDALDYIASRNSETGNYIVKIIINKILPCNVYMSLHDTLENKLQSKVGLFIINDNDEYNLKEVKDYINYYVDNIYKNPEELEFIKKQSISIRHNELVIKYNNVFVEKQLDNIKVKLTKYLNAVGFNKLTLNYCYIEPETFDYEKDSLNYEKLREEYQQFKEQAEKQDNNQSTDRKTFNRRPNFSNKEFIKCELDNIPSDVVDIESEVKVFDVIAEGKSRKHFKINVTNYKASMTCHMWINKNYSAEDIEACLNKWIIIKGTISYNQFDKENSVELFNFTYSDRKDEVIEDNEEEKRIELHAHTNMSAMDGIADVTDLINTAVRYGHKAIAITDHVACQSYPDAQKVQEKLDDKGIDFKVIYGIEINVAPRSLDIIKNPSNDLLKDSTYVFFDLETSGLSCKFDKIIEFGAVKVKNGLILERKDILINPGFNVSSFTTSLTNITNEMLADKPKIEDVIEEIKEFIKDSVLVAHNASFDIGFLTEAIGSKINNPIIDTLPLCRYLYQDEKRYTLGAMCRNNSIDYDEESAHRGDYDAEVLKELYDVLLAKLVNENIALTTEDLTKLQSNDVTRKMHPYHVNLLAKNATGLKNIFKILSIANTDYFTAQALVPPSIIDEHKEGLLIGSSCARGEIFELASTKDEETLKEAMKWYDYIEIQPLDQYQVLVDTERVESIDKVKQIIQFIVDTAKSINKPICATSDCHYVRIEQHIAREVFISIPAIGGGVHPLFDGKGRIKEYPYQEFKTTRQMLDAFAWLGNEKEYVIDNPKLIASQIEKVYPIKKKLYPPFIENSEKLLTDACYEKAHQMYGQELPEIVKSRLERELSCIIGNGYSIMYVLAMKSVKKSNSEGFLVGSRGSVGSSFAATCAGITEVNPLKPHYRCPHCGYSDFNIDSSIRSGFDLPDKECPVCHHNLIGDGHNIPFETFMGFNGEKVPDIDLNFSALNQADAHNYIRELFGYDHVFRAGTIATAASKTAFGYAKKYFEKKNMEISNAEAARIAKMCEGVKRTTGQHPGGIIVVPNEMDVYDFTPVGHPADDIESDWLTTHMDYHAIHDNILKLDMLGHVDPTAIRMLENLTNLKATDIPNNDLEVFKMFNGDPFIDTEDNKLTSIGLPEFGTNVARKMLVDTKPTCFADLTALAGLAHGTDVFFDNERDLFVNGICTIDNCIGCRDDIMTGLINYGIDKLQAFEIMEFVRKGKAKENPAKWDKYKAILEEKNVPQWYIDACYKIKYLFPKAHAVAYCLMSYRIAYYKLYYPIEYYATYFTTRSDAYDIDAMINGIDDIKRKYFEIQDKKNRNEKLSTKESGLDTFYEVAIEMYQRGYKFGNIDIEKSDAFDFVVDHENKMIIPSFKVLDGIGSQAALSVIEARKQGPFLSKDDLIERTKLNGTNIKLLEKLHVLDKLPDTAQLTLFNF